MTDLEHLDRPELEKLVETLQRDQAHTLEFLRTFTRSDFSRHTEEMIQEVLAYALTQSNLIYGINRSTYFEYDTFSDCFVGKYSLGSTTTEEWFEAMRGLLEIGNIEEVVKQGISHLVPLDLVIPLDSPSIFKTLRNERKSYLGQPIEYTEVDKKVVGQLGEPFVAITLKGAEGKTIGFIYGSNLVTHDPIEISNEQLDSFNSIRYPAAQRLEFIKINQEIKHKRIQLSRGVGAARVAHDIRNKLVVVIGGNVNLLTRLMEEKDWEATKEPIEVILEEVNLIDMELRQIMDFSIPANPKPEKFNLLPDLRTLVESTVNACPHLDRKRPDYEIDSDVPELCIYADRSHLTRNVLSNLISNAVDAICDERTAAGYVAGVPNILKIKVKAAEQGRIIIKNR
ncbi:MAG: hypothetical protein ABIJ20_03515 [Nanoarchaeota archaeon]|nr:hypothetical protein [Nanoarchaeota archaeon]MBU1444747.1 hypothetical protein [Nanoarchaeota archaeon]MBU2420110.1 hypothetical protein [Nanoarchaeota archaeon]MBU2474876.1 hypothetical protein [Nanoarchaeota archaeon]